MYKLTHLFLNQQCSFMAMRHLGRDRIMIQRASLSSSAVKWEGGVSMLQGASRGIGFEFESAKSIREKYGSLNLLINASGILSIPNVLQPAYASPEVGGGLGTDRDVAVVANMSARVGSIGDNSLGGWHSYRASKTALNQRVIISLVPLNINLTKNVSVEFARRKDPIVCILMHPGTVDTDLSKPFQKNVPEGKLFTTEFSVQKLLSIIHNAKKNDNGKFYAWDGQEIPW